MAAPDRAYRFFTNLISKTVEGNTIVKHYIRCAKPLQGYVGSNQTYAQQLETFKAKFKVDGILWIKNNDIPKTANDDPNTVTITLPDEVDEHGDPVEITLVDPDLGDPNRDGIIAYVYPNSPNAKYHDIRTQGIQGSSNTTDYSTRSWSRASKFRFIDYDHNYPNSGGESAEQSESVAAIILNDAGLNRRGECTLESLSLQDEDLYISSYIHNASNSEHARFNDMQMLGKFFSTPYNRLYSSILEMATIEADNPNNAPRGPWHTTSAWTQVANYGPIGRTGIAGDPDVGFPVRFVSRRNPDGNETGRITTISFPESLIDCTITTVAGSGVGADSTVTVHLSQYAARVKTRNEEGEVISDPVPYLDIAMYKWNVDDSILGEYGEAHKTNTDRISVSHADPETSIARYNAQLPFTIKQYDSDDLNSTTPDPEPYSKNYIDGLGNNPPEDNGVVFIYTTKEIFPYERDPVGSRQGVTSQNLIFFTGEQDGATMLYKPLQTGPYIIHLNPGGGASTGEPSAGGGSQSEGQSAYYSSFLTMKCKIDNSETGTHVIEDGVFCIEYSIYDFDNYGNWPFIRRYWKLEYDGTDWYWPKSRYNQNVTVRAIIDDYDSSGPSNIGYTMLSNNVDYGLNLLIRNLTKGELFDITVENTTPGVIDLYTADGTIINTQGGKQTYEVVNREASGKVTRVKNLLKVRRTSTTFTDVAKLNVTIEYKSYENMASAGSEATANHRLTTLGYNQYVSGIMVFNAYSDFGHENSYNLGRRATPEQILSAGKPLEGNTGLEDTIYYLGAAPNNNILYTSENASATAPQGYYIRNCSREHTQGGGINDWTYSASPEDIFYVDNNGAIEGLGS